MIWLVIENWFWIAVVGGYLAVVGFAYVRFGKEAAVAVATIGGAALVYSWGREGEREKQRRAAEQARRYRDEVEQDVRDMGAQDIDRELTRWNRD